jgi:hypothetical protein
MAADRMLRFLLALTVVAVVTGCGRTPESNFPDWTARAAPVDAPVSPEGAFAVYIAAAESAEIDGQKYLDRVSFFPGQKVAAAEAVSKAFQSVLQASSKPALYSYEPRGPFDDVQYHRGWRLLGRVFVWKIEEAVRAEDYDTAVRLATAGSRFGFDLTGGGALDAALGLSLVNEIRQSIVPSLDRMTPAQQSALADGMASALARQADAETIARHEQQNMMLAIQAVQDHFQKEELRKLSDLLGSSVRPAVDWLVDLRKEDREEQVDYFEGFAEEAMETSRSFVQRASLPAKARDKTTLPKLRKERPWRRFAMHFFGTLDPLLEMRDTTTARTRLLALQARLLAGSASGFPDSLAAMPEELTVDPFSGQPFMYRHDGVRFVVYSIGANHRDDGGESNDTFDAPDLRLELPL